MQRQYIVFAALVVLSAPVNSHGGDYYPVVGRVVAADGKPVQHAMVSSWWRANGSPTKPDGTQYDLSDKEERDQFWGDLGNMQPWYSPTETKTDGTFEISLPKDMRHLLAMDASRTRGAVVEIADPDDQSQIEIRLEPLVTVRGKVKSNLAQKPASWSLVCVELPKDNTKPLANRRIVLCAAVDGYFEFRLPRGTYRLETNGGSDEEGDTIDFWVTPTPQLKIDGKQQEIDLGTLQLSLAPPSRPDLEKSSKESGRWHDYTKHYGEPAPPWHAVDARGITPQTTIKDFRGKWLMIDFWGLGCSGCLSRGIPTMMQFYDEHADKRDRFEIIGVCVDIYGRIDSLAELDSELAPIVKHVWKGREIEFPVVLDNTFQTWERYGIPGLGTVVLVDPDGNLAEGDESTLHQILERASETSVASETSKTP